MKQQRQPQITHRYERKLVEFAFFAAAIFAISYFMNPAIAAAGDRWHLAFWQREAAYTLGAIAVIVVAVLASAAVVRLAFTDTASRNDVTGGQGVNQPDQIGST